MEILVEKQERQDNVILYDGFHDYIKFRVRGILPADREKMLDKLDKEILYFERQEPVFSYVQGECPDLEKCDGLNKVWDMA